MLLFFGRKVFESLNFSLFSGIKSTKKWNNFTPMPLIGPMLLLIFENVWAYALIQDYAFIRTLRVELFFDKYHKCPFVRIHPKVEKKVAGGHLCMRVSIIKKIQWNVCTIEHNYRIGLGRIGTPLQSYYGYEDFSTFNLSHNNLKIVRNSSMSQSNQKATILCLGKLFEKFSVW